MFNKLKSAIRDGPVRAAVENFSQQVSEKLAEITRLSPADITDDARYKDYVVLRHYWPLMPRVAA